MVFCGRCGLQLAPGSTRCPRCGALTEVDVVPEDPHMNDPTMISLHRNDPNTVHSSSPQIILRPDEHPSYPGLPTSYPSGQAYTPLPSGDPVSHPSYYPPSMPGQYDTWNTPAPQPPRRRKGGLIALIVVIILVLLIAGATAIVLLQPSLLTGLLGNQVTPTPAQTAPPGTTATSAPTATSTPTPVEQARAVIEHYYTDVNAKDYSDAYNLWGNAYHQSQSYDAYAAGYANTLHDNITILSLTEQPDGTVVASVIVAATEQTSSGGQVVSTYQGTYVIGVEDGTWKLLSGHFTKTG